MNINEIQTEITRLEQEETTYQNCTKLAVLYSIRNNLGKEEEKITEYSLGSSEFIQAVSGAPINAVLNILDEHLEAIKILHPKEYSVIITRIKSLS